MAAARRWCRAAGRAGPRRAPAILGGMVDWQLAGKVAEGVAALQPAGDPGPFRAVAGPTEESERLVGAYTGLRPVDPLPVAEAVDRPAWIRANLTGLQGVLDPAAERVTLRMGNLAGPVGTAAGAVLGVGAGGGWGFLPPRVFVQYEFRILEQDAPARLLFAAPNLGHAARTLDARPDELLT